MSDSPEGHEHALHTRHIGQINGETWAVQVDHVFTMETCEHGHPDQGLVGLVLDDEDGAATALMEPEEALLLADRITRAAQLVLEAAEEIPDAARDLQRLAAGT